MKRELKEIADVIGLGDALELVRRWGGRQLDVPKTARPGDPLALTMGYDCAKRLVDAFGGRRFELPAERNALLDLRNAAIVDMVAAGTSHEKAALAFGLSRPAINYILRKHREREELRRKFTATPAAIQPGQSAQQ